MNASQKILIFTDLDGTLLDRDTFKFDKIFNYIKELISKDISIIPTSSKTKKEIENFNKELDENLPFVTENGAAIYNLNLINKSLPEKLLSREIDEISEIFEKNILLNLDQNVNFQKLTDKQLKILAQKRICYAINREYTMPLVFEGTKTDKIDLFKSIQMQDYHYKRWKSY